MIKLGKYELIKRLARGGMAELLLARQAGPEGFEKLLVIKRLLQSLTDQQDIVRMFLNEARIAARLTHPHIVQIFDLGQSDEEYFIAMEYVSGRDLRAVQKHADKQGRPLPYELSAYVLACVCRALHHAHTLRDSNGVHLGLVHRDVSPHNVLLSFTGDVKLADFGIAKATALAAETQAGVLKGKFAYMSPEQIRGEELDARSDIFSAGILLHELVCWQRLFRRETDFATIRAVESEKIPRPKTVRNDVPDPLEQIVMRALERNRSKRYQTAQEMQLDLENAIVDFGWQCGPVELGAFMTELFWQRQQERDASATLQAMRKNKAKASMSPKPPPHQRPTVTAPRKSHANQNDLGGMNKAHRRKNASRSRPQPPRVPAHTDGRASATETLLGSGTLLGSDDLMLADPFSSDEDAPPTIIKPPDFDDIVLDEQPYGVNDDRADDNGSLVNPSSQQKKPAPAKTKKHKTRRKSQSSRQPNGQRPLQVLLIVGIIVSLSLAVIILVLIATGHRG